MKKYIFLCLLIYAMLFLLFVRHTDSKTDKLLNDESLLPNIELIEAIFPNQEISLKKDNINKNGNVISLILVIESENHTSWVTNARYEITSLDCQPNLQASYHYWNLRDEKLKIYEDETCNAYLLRNQEVNGEPIDCLVGKLNNDSTSVYYFSHLKEEITQSEIISEIAKMKELFKY